MRRPDGTQLQQRQQQQRTLTGSAAARPSTALVANMGAGTEGAHAITTCTQDPCRHSRPMSTTATQRTHNRALTRQVPLGALKVPRDGQHVTVLDGRSGGHLDTHSPWPTRWGGEGGGGQPQGRIEGTSGTSRTWQPRAPKPWARQTPASSPWRGRGWLCWPGPGSPRCASGRPSQCPSETPAGREKRHSTGSCECATQITVGPR